MAADRTVDGTSEEARLRDRVAVLEARVALLEGVLEALPDPLFVKDSEHRFVLVNSRCEALVGCERQEMYGRSDADLFPSGQVEGFWEEDDRVLRGDVLVSERTEDLQIADGSTQVISTRKALGQAPEGGPLIVGTIRDLSEALAQLAEQSARNRTASAVLERISTSFPMGVALFAADGTMDFATGPELRQMGLTPERMAGESLEGLTPLWPDVVPHIRAALRGEARARLLPWRGSHRHVTTAPVFDADGTVGGATLISMDTTAQEELDHRIAASERMNSLARLAGGVAHDLNNMLSIVMMGTSALRDAMAAGDAAGARGHVRLLERSIERGSRLSRQLVAFARRQVGPPVVVDVARDLQAVAVFLESVVSADTDLRFVVPEASLRVRLQPGQLEQVLIHLVTHAAQVGGGSRVEVRVEPLEVDGDPELRSGAFVALRVRDRGPALSPGARERLFEPFFDADGRRGGSGLGLATCYGIARQAGGRVRALAAEGGGNLVEVLLPRTFDEPERPPIPPVPAAPDGSRGRILLVEDDPVLRDQVAQFLRTSGHVVHTAEDGLAALEWLETRMDEVDAVVSDVVMPRMTGVELAEALDGRLPVVLVTGFIGEQGQAVAALARRIPVLDKPVRPTELLRAIAQVIRS